MLAFAELSKDREEEVVQSPEQLADEQRTDRMPGQQPRMVQKISRIRRGYYSM